jgi:STE24 endopeptidase
MQENQERAKLYSRLKTRVTVIQVVGVAVFLAVLLFSGASTLLAQTVKGWNDNFYVQVALYLLILEALVFIPYTLLAFYSGFVLEHRFELSNQTLLAWLKKRLKLELLGIPLMLVLAETLYLLLRYASNTWWLWMTAASVLVVVFLGKILPRVIIPLFYKCRPLTNTQLKEKLLTLAQDCGVCLKDVFEVQVSKETKTANACVAGFGRTRRVLLDDTLLSNYSCDEIEAVFAHELGHIKLLHFRKGFGFAAAGTLIAFCLISLLFQAALRPLGFSYVYEIGAFPLLALIGMFVALTLVPIDNWHSRRQEEQADSFALERINQKASFISALTKLADQDLEDPSPGKLQLLFLYTHPPISQRLKSMGSSPQTAK